MTEIVVELGTEFPDLTEVVDELVGLRFASRLVGADATLWGDAAQEEASIRLGWIDAIENSREVVVAATQLRDDLNARGIRRVVLSGMGGSSLAPELICREANVPLTVLDSTHPDQVAAALDGKLAETVVVVSSKSGSTVETRSHRDVFTHSYTEAGLNPADHIVVVTDPGSPLEASARQAGSRVFLADPNVGGRYSALTAFGLVSSILAGADVHELLADAQAVRDVLAEDSANNPALTLGAAIASGLPEQFALIVAPNPTDRSGLGDWIEQLIAESTGKEENGILPVAVRGASPETGIDFSAHALRLWAPLSPTRELTSDELAVSAPLGAQFMLWEAATVVAGALIGINPFDQPDVESAKIAAREVLEQADREPLPEQPLTSSPVTRVGGYLGDPTQPQTLAEEVSRQLDQIAADGYLSIQAYVNRESEHARLYFALRDSLAKQLSVPVTLGFGPRFLHSTGQFHKGGPRTGVFLQLRDVPTQDVVIPGQSETFSQLLEAQADGDASVLSKLGRPVLVLRLLDTPQGLRELEEIVRSYKGSSAR